MGALEIPRRRFAANRSDLVIRGTRPGTPGRSGEGGFWRPGPKGRAGLGWGRNDPEWSRMDALQQPGSNRTPELDFGQITPREIKIPNQELCWEKDFSKMSFR